MSDDYELSDGTNVVMRLSRVAYGALYQTALLDRVLQLIKARLVATAWTVVEEAMALADSLECPWCDRLGLHEQCWAARTEDPS